MYEAVAVQYGMYDSMEFEATKAYVTDNGNFAIVPVSIYTACIQHAYIVQYIAKACKYICLQDEYSVNTACIHHALSKFSLYLGQ